MGRKKSRSGGKGRPRSAGKRTPAGQLSRAGKHVEPNQRVLDVRFAFRWFQGGKAVEHLFDPVGRLWAVGALDGCGADPAALRDAAREYGDGYWAYYRGTAPVVGNYEGGSGSGRGPTGGDLILDDFGGEHFQKLDEAVTRTGARARDALHDLVVDHFHFPDENPAWADRLINGRLLAEWARLRKKNDVLPPPIAGALPTGADKAKLRDAVLAIMALVAGTRQVRPAPKDGPSLAELTRPAELDEVAAPTVLRDVDPAFLDGAGRMRPWAEIAEVIRDRMGEQEAA